VFSSQFLRFSLEYESSNFHFHAMHRDIIKVFHSPTDAQVNCLKNNIKIYVKTAFGAVIQSSGNALFVLAKVTVINIVN
jgi:hypothetical protein